MSDEKSILDQIADEIGEITEKQEDDEPDESEEQFNPEDYYRNKNDYDGGW